MGLMKVAAKSITKLAISKTVITVDKKLKEKSNESKNKFFEKKPGSEILVIDENQFSLKDKFEVFDENKIVKYIVNGEFASIKPHLHIYNSSGKEIGTVKQKLISLRIPILKESNPVDFVIEINGEKVGMVKSKWAFGKQVYAVSINGWRIEGNIFGWKYKIFNGSQEIADISVKILYSGDLYYLINFSNPEKLLTSKDLIIGDKFIHERFGELIVQSIEGNIIYALDTNGTKRVVSIIKSIVDS